MKLTLRRHLTTRFAVFVPRIFVELHRTVFSVVFLLITIWIVSPNLFAQKFDGTYKGRLSGDLDGTFEFTITNNYNLSGNIKSSVQREITGYVSQNGVIHGAVVDKGLGANYKNYFAGDFKGQIEGNGASGEWSITGVKNASNLNCRGTWSTDTVDSPDSVLTYEYVLGNEIPFSEEKATALRIKVRLTDANRDKFSIARISPGAENPAPGRFAAAVDNSDRFYVYTNSEGLFLNPPPKTKEADFEFPFVSFGIKPTLNLPKKFTSILHVTLKSEIRGEGDRVEKLEVPIRINSLFTVLVAACGTRATSSCPSLKNQVLTKGKMANGVSGDELVIPMGAHVWVKFLDGTIGYFTNRADYWRLTMRAGRFDSPQGHTTYTENALEIKGVASQALETSAGKVSDKTVEAGLELIVRRAATVSAPGLILQLSEFLGASAPDGNYVAVRLRSKLSVTYFMNGTMRIQNLEGTPELLRKQGTPLMIPVGNEVVIDQKGVISAPARISNYQSVKNLALNHPARQSSTSDWSKANDAQGAVDGVKNGSFGFHTNIEKDPWWEVDLGETKTLTEIRIFNRFDCCAERARTIQVLLSNDGLKWTRVFANGASVFGTGVNKPLIISLKGRSARYVRLQLAEKNWFHLDEVEVY